MPIGHFNADRSFTQNRKFGFMFNVTGWKRELKENINKKQMTIELRILKSV